MLKSEIFCKTQKPFQTIIFGLSFMPFKFPFSKSSDKTMPSIDLIQKIVSDLGVTLAKDRIRLKDSNLKLILHSVPKAQQELLIKTLQAHYPDLSVTIIQEAEVKPQKPKMPHAPKDNIRPSSIKKILIVASGKGGVGKSLVSLSLARAFQKQGLKTALVDCDIYGPSMPVMTGGYVQAGYDSKKLQPVVRDGIKVMSIGYMIDPAKPVIWRGPMVSGAIGQIFQDTDWGEIDIAVVDMPPGTGDAQLTICQNLNPDGVVIVSQPQMVSVIDAERCAGMFDSLNIPVWGVIENMSGFIAPDTGKTYYIFGQGGAEAFAHSRNYPFLGALPITPQMAYCADQGIDPHTDVGCKEFLQRLEKIAGQLALEKEIA